MRKVNYVKLMGVIAMLSPMTFGQSHEIDLKSHTVLADNTRVDIGFIKQQAEAEEKEKQESIADLLDPVAGAIEVKGLQGESVFDIQEDLKQTLKQVQEDVITEDKKEEKLVIITEAPKAPVSILSLIDPMDGAIEVTDLKGESVFDIQEDLKNILKEAQEMGQVQEVKALDDASLDHTSEVAQEIIATVDTKNERTNLEQVVCEQKNQIEQLTKTIEELKENTQAPVDSMYQMMSQLMMMNQMMMMQNQNNGGFYQRAGSNYEMMNSYLEPMRMMSSMMYSNQQLMLSNMYGSSLGALSSGPTYNVTGDYYAGNYTNTATTTSPQNYQLPLPAAMSADYQSFGNIIQAPRSPAAQENKANLEATLEVPQTSLNDISESV